MLLELLTFVCVCPCACVVCCVVQALRRLALLGQVLFLGALALGLQLGGLVGAGWAVSAAMLGYFGFYLLALWRWRAPALPRAPHP